MKKIVASILLIMPPLLTLGQVTYNDSRENFLSVLQENKIFRAHLVAEHIASMQVIGYKHNELNGSPMHESRYDKVGNTTDWITYKNGKVKLHNTFNHDDSARLTSFSSYSGSGKFKLMETNIYDKAGNRIEQDLYKKNPQTISLKTIDAYDNRNNITESKAIDGKGKLKTRIEYSYYDDGSKKQTIEYSGKGKVLRIWNFDCNPVGTLEAKEFKDTDKVCIHYETDKDGNPIKVKEEYQGGTGVFGSTLRYVSKYDKDNNMIDEAYYAMNGKQLSHESFSYNAFGKITEYIWYKGATKETRLKNVYTYDNDGNMTGTSIYKKANPIPSSTEKYVYASAAAPVAPK
jgi:hypothetical protein